MVIEQEVVAFLNQLAMVQEKILDVLKRKQILLVKPDKESLAAITAEEELTLLLLQQTLDYREKILESAKKQEHNADSIRILCEQIFPKPNNEWRLLVDAAQNRNRQIRYLALANWTVSQKSLIHLTQILEIIETRGQGKTTYEPQKGKKPYSSGGGFVDRVA
ncbi:MAG: flagellar protein FlgN [Planctomycetaceae bacterium]|nr:flagellar protein FlgN [Planctomycetaceae bacterium]